MRVDGDINIVHTTYDQARAGKANPLLMICNK